MKSPLPKVLHAAGGQPLLFHILDKVLKVFPSSPIGIVVGHGREQVEAAVHAEGRYKSASIAFLLQKEQKGTGHAARAAMDTDWGKTVLKEKRSLLVLPGDLPLMTSELVRQVGEPLGRSAAMRLLTCELPDPTGYGRIIRKGRQGPVLRIVEEKDANIREKSVNEVAASIYLFHGQFLSAGLARLSNKNAQGEYYLTDLVAQASRAKKTIEVLKWSEIEDLRGVNDPWELGLAQDILNRRIVRRWAREGIFFRDVSAVWIDATAQIGPGVSIGPGSWIRGKTSIGSGVEIGANVVIKDCRIEEGAEIRHGCVLEDSMIEKGAKLGPYAHLRPESMVGAGAKIGNFVELKKTRIGRETSVAHLSYLGDAEVGARVNIGCGFVTCNFDGRVINGSRKHKTIIEDDVFMGSDCQTIAPVKVGKGSYVASGSTITEEVPPESLAIARSRQVTKPGYAKKLKG
jgi:bifunctional UDP-N-acetylglucosamine pyrophosphorylase/glucosamine-1-phosphate N-acetyltransferase